MTPNDCNQACMTRLNCDSNRIDREFTARMVANGVSYLATKGVKRGIVSFSLSSFHLYDENTMYCTSCAAARKHTPGECLSVLFFGSRCT